MRLLRWIVRLFAVLVLVAVGPPLAASLFGIGAERGMLPPPGKRVEIGSAEFVNVIETGQGTPVVLVHGLPSNAYDWGALPAKLATLGHRVIAYDRVGYGFSSRADASPSNYTYESNAEDLAALLAALEIPRATLVGWSYGGAVVQTLARSHPEMVNALVLVGAVGPALWEKGDDPLHAVLSSPVGAPLLRWIAAVPPLSRVVTSQSVARAFGGAEAVPIGWVDYTRAMLALPGSLRSFVLEAQRGIPKQLDPARIDAKTLVIHGGHDLLVPVEVGRDLDEKLPNSRLVVVTDGSHMLPVTHSDLLAGEIHGLIAN